MEGAIFVYVVATIYFLSSIHSDVKDILREINRMKKQINLIEQNMFNEEYKNDGE